METKTHDLSTIDFGEAKQLIAAGGSRTYGNTVIAWDPSTTEPSVKVTVTMGGSLLAQKTMKPDDNQMTYNGASGEDWSKGQINASFDPAGKGGSLNGNLEWKYRETHGTWYGMIGTWEV